MGTRIRWHLFFGREAHWIVHDEIFHRHPFLSSPFLSFFTSNGIQYYYFYYVVSMLPTSSTIIDRHKRQYSRALPQQNNKSSRINPRTMSSEQTSDEYDSSDGDINESFINEDVSLVDDLLRAKLDRIVELEQEINEKDTEVANMRQQVVEMEVKRKHQVYNLRLEYDTCRREKDATEERLAEVYKDMQLLVQPEKNKKSQDDNNDNDDSELEEAKEKFQHALSIKDSQMQMIRTSYDEIIKTLKEEIVEITDAGTQQELVLINQLENLDKEKKEAEEYLMQKVEEKEEAMENLRRRQGGRDGRSICSGDIEELENELSALLLDKTNLQEELALEQEKSHEAICILEQTNSMLEEKVQALASDLAVQRAGVEGVQTTTASMTITREEDIGAFIDRVAEIREQAELSVNKLAKIIHVAKAGMDLEDSEVEIGDDAEMVLSISESAALVHDQVNLSLRLIELQLQNRLKLLRNEKYGSAGDNNKNIPRDTILVHKMDQVTDDTKLAISKAEEGFSEQMEHLEEHALHEMKRATKELEQSSESIKQLENENAALRQEINDCKAARLASDQQESNSDERASSDVETLCVSKHTVEQLEMETLRVVAVVRIKNEAIKTLSDELAKYKIRDKELQAQLSRISAFPTSPANNSKTSSSRTAKSRASSRFSTREGRKENTTPTKLSPRSTTITPLRPSSREIFAPQSAKPNKKIV
mmetsp:Transcript_18466/g.45768  ORF Transcript_18466/g.45768 Transcript_18466/m.45768 type:complete len:707 (+) Transcript_18466:138-2258(+)